MLNKLVKAKHPKGGNVVFLGLPCRRQKASAYFSTIQKSPWQFSWLEILLVDKIVP